jgi:hypothetical protein
MPVEPLFSAANLFALVGWAALALAPLRRGMLIAVARWVAALLAGSYAALLIFGLIAGGGGGEAPDFSSAAGLARAFSRPEVMLVGWAHYLAFDLWVGAWIAEDAPTRGVPHWAVLPILFFTLMAGPVGLLAYLVVRATRRPRAKA